MFITQVDCFPDTGQVTWHALYLLFLCPALMLKFSGIPFSDSVLPFTSVHMSKLELKRQGTLLCIGAQGCRKLKFLNFNKYFFKTLIKVSGQFLVIISK